MRSAQIKNRQAATFLGSRVFSNIPILLKGLFCSLLLFTSLAHSQDTEKEAPAQQASLEETSSETTEQSATSAQSILRLEDTIRGNKEQPQVLTIVPWQLPVHQRINENEQWGLKVNQLSSIERNAFLRRLAVVKEIKAVQTAQEQE